MKFAFQIDAVKEITINNCTLAMMEEAANRGYEIYHFTPEALSEDKGKIYARANKVKVDLDSKNFIELGEEVYVPLAEFDAVFVRQEPNLNTRFLINSFMLEKAMQDTWIINNPISMRNAVEKLNFFGLDEYRAPTLISRDKKTIAEFRAQHGEIVIKPLCGYGGSGVFHVSKTDMNLNVIIDSLVGLSGVPLVVQKYLPEVLTEGDKRVLLIFGKIAGSYTRLPAPAEMRANFWSGGSIHKTELTEREELISHQLASTLHAQGIEIAGIDLIGGHLSEVNFITPAGFFPLRKLYNIYPEKLMWDYIEGKLCRK